ncbi:hypothetical protein GJQ54_00690 [Oceanospirillaceae bacterium ASx5O]|nr:hypothetical protein GJQ54_00690 [Oceanospirillaceae bacterium ASx5O]
MKTSKTALTCRFFPIDAVSVTHLRDMYQVFSRYYANTDLETFVNDMSRKSGVFLLREKKGQRIVGFSTWTEVPLQYNGKKSIGVFSGDTILEKDYWGNKALQQAFAVRMLKLKLTKPGTKVFWLLISKGYKTYLLLANNFFRHYPNHNSHNKRLVNLVDQYCEKLFPDYYDREKRLLDFGENSQHLKDEVADITINMRENNHRIRFFDDTNPSWRRGTELPCVGEVCTRTLMGFFHKQLSGRRTTAVQ